MNEFAILRKADITDGDFAEIAKVSRTTVSLWVNGHAKPHRLHKKSIDTLLAAVKQAVALKELPFKQSMDKEARMKRLRTTITWHLRNLPKS